MLYSGVEDGVSDVDREVRGDDEATQHKSHPHNYWVVSIADAVDEVAAHPRHCKGGILKKCVNSQAVYPLSEQHGLKARERRYTAHEEGKHWE